MDISSVNQQMLSFIATRSRRDFFATSAKVLAVGAGAVALKGQSTGTPSELDVLNYALTLEFLEASYYTQFLGPGTMQPNGGAGLVGPVSGNPPAFAASDFAAAKFIQGFGPNVMNTLFGYLNMIRDHEQAHVAGLLTIIKSLGGTPVQPCTYTFPVKTADDFIMVAQSLENVGVSAYDGAINLLKTPALLTGAATIATVEARHASYLNLLNGTSPFPAALDMTRTMQQVLAIAGPFIVSCTSSTTPQTMAVVTPNMLSTVQSQVLLDASASTSGAGKLTYAFTVLPGGLVPAIFQSSPNSPTATVQFSTQGTYLLQLTVTDANGKTSTANITLNFV